MYLDIEDIRIRKKRWRWTKEFPLDVIFNKGQIPPRNDPEDYSESIFWTLFVCCGFIVSNRCLLLFFHRCILTSGVHGDVFIFPRNCVLDVLRKTSPFLNSM